MVVLSQSTDKIQIVTSSTAALDVQASVVDVDQATGAVFTPAPKNTAITTAATTDVVTCPASTTRNVKLLTMRNKDATVSNDVTVKHVIGGGTTVEMLKCTVGAGEELVLNDAGTWFHYDTNGAVITGAIAATTTLAGIVKLASTTDVLTGTDAAKATTPASLQAVLKQGADVASAATVTMGDGDYFNITGTVTITALAFTTAFTGRQATLKFASAGGQITHNGTSLILPGAVNIITAAGDTATFVFEGGSNFRCIQYMRANPTPSSNPANAAQTSGGQQIAAATTAYLTNSNIAIPGSKLRLGTILKWKICVTKSAAGTAANTFIVKLGTAGTTGDTSILTFTTLAGTALADTGWVDITVVCLGPLSASGVLSGLFHMTHNLQTTGLMILQTQVLQANSATFDVTTANLIAGITVTTAASTVLNFPLVAAESNIL